MRHCLKITTLICTTLFIPLVNATKIGHIALTDPVMGNLVLTYEEIDHYAVIEGDILLGKASNLNHQGAVITHKIGGSRWSHGVVAYEISEDLPIKNKLSIMQAIKHWQSHSNLEFVELNSKNRNEYRDYISFIPASGTICSSFVGRQGGRQVINLSTRCSDMNTVHEIGHALGMWHEQSRADRDAYIQIMWENIEENHKFNFEQHLTDGKDFGIYDYYSIMHYGPYAFSKNGQQTIIPLAENVHIGQRDGLSEKDIVAINAMYPEV